MKKRIWVNEKEIKRDLIGEGFMEGLSGQRL